MRKKIVNLLPLPLLLYIFSCSSTPEKVTLTFIQHTFVNFHYSENNELDGYIFKNDEIARTEIEFDKGYYLTDEDIKGFYDHGLNYDVPELNGDGYYSFTFFTIDLDEETGFSHIDLDPCVLNEDMTIHFGIFG